MSSKQKFFKWKALRKKISIVAILLAVFAIPSDGSYGQSSKDIALILKTRGQVAVNRGTNGTWEKAKRGMRLHSGNVIKTGDNSLAALVFTDDKSLIKIRSNSEVTVKGKREKAKVKKSLFMRLGELWARVTQGNPFQVETPSGVAAVKGTEFYVLTDENGNTIVFCTKGLIEFFNRLGKVDLNPGEKGQVSLNGLPVKSKSKPGEVPDWAGADNGINELKIEFQDENGQKKILKIRYK